MDVDPRQREEGAGARPVTGREAAFVLAQAVLMFLALTAWNPHPCLYDDNLSQWLPVADQGISDLLAGEPPVWNPYLLGGIRVDLVGYYGFANPIMIAAHLLGRTGLSNTLSLYIALTFVLGSLFAHLLARRLGSDWKRSFLLVVMYQMSLTFWRHEHWYYVFNNFLMGPAILWGVHRFLDADDDADDGPDRRARAWQLGGIIGLAAGLGNVQYSFSQWMLAAGVLLPPLAASGRLRRDRFNLVRIAATAGVIALPTVWMAASAGKFPLATCLACSGYPLSPWAAFGHNLRLGAIWDFDLPPGVHAEACRVGGLAIMACGTLAALAVALVRRRTAASDRAFINGLACLGVLAVFLTFASGLLIARLPVLNNFRYAFKWWFLVPPLALELACLTPRLTPRWNLPRKLDTALLALGLAWGVSEVAPLYPLGGTAVDETPYDLRGFAELRRRIDLDNHRYLPIVAGPAIHLVAVDAHASQAFAGDHLCANVPAYLKEFSVVGYHVGFDPAQVDSIRDVSGSISFFYGVPLDLTDATDTVPLQEIDPTLADADDGEATRRLAGRGLPDGRVLDPGGTVGNSPENRFWSVFDGKLRITREWRPKLSGWRERFQSAGIRYLIGPSQEIDQAIETLKAAEPGKSHAWNVIRGPRYSAIEIAGAQPIVADADGGSIDFVTRGNGLTAFVGSRDEATDVAVRFNFDRLFRAVATSLGGSQTRLDVTRGPDGTMRVHLPAGDWSRLELRINDDRVLAAVLANLFACGLIAAAAIGRRARVANAEVLRTIEVAPPRQVRHAA